MTRRRQVLLPSRYTAASTSQLTARQAEALVEEAASTAPPTVRPGDKLKAELDELLDEIDEVLEDNAEEFVRSYVQKGGQ